MNDQSLTFLSNRGVGLNSDLKLVESYLTQNFQDKEVNYRFFLKNGKSKNPMARQGFTRAKKEFCANMHKVICVDASLDFKMDDLEEGDVRILLATPYDYQFKNALLLEKGKKRENKKKTFRRFTHIIAGSPFSAQILKSVYDLEQIQLIEHVSIPSAWQINQVERRQEANEQFQFYFPDMAGKKVMSIMVYGKEPERKNFLKNFDIRSLLDRLGKGWFVMTNMVEIMEAAYVLDAKYKDSFGYVGRILPGQEVLIVSDVLVTNNGRFASYFSSRGKQVFCPRYSKNSFERYIEEKFPDLFLATADDFMNCSFSSTNLKEQQKEFNHLFSYDPVKSPYDSIAELLFGQASGRIEKKDII